MKKCFSQLEGCIIPRYIGVVLYLFSVGLFFRNREIILSVLPLSFKEMLGNGLILDMMFYALLFAFSACLFYLFYPPSYFMKKEFRKAFERIGLHNSKGEYPVLRAVRSDKSKPHIKVYTVDNVGISIPQIDKETAQLENALGMKICSYDYGKRARTTRIFAIRNKYVKPTVISHHDKYLTELPNLLCVGKTGSGKSYALSLLIGLYAKYIPDVSITVCDYKKSSFAHFSDTPNFFGYEEVSNGIRKFYKEFSERLAANDEKRNSQICVLLIDEYGALISAQEKKAAEELKAMIANMLFMGRSLGMRVIIGTQRADAEHFKAGARDQFRAILALGNLSKEQKQMLFSDYKEQMTANNDIGEGYLLIDGRKIERVKILAAKEQNDFNDSIRKAMCR